MHDAAIPSVRLESSAQRWRITLRALEIAGLTGVWAVRLSAAIAVNSFARRPRTAKALFGRDLPRLFEALGPTFVKIGQILSARADLLPPEIVVPLQRLQDDVVTPERTPVGDRLAAVLGPKRMREFARVETAPYAAGSIAEVYCARLHDGRDVVVKLRRRRAARTIDSDFRLLAAVAALLARLPAMRAVPIADIVEEIRVAVTDQLDFSKEAESNRVFRARFRHAERIRFPEIIDALSGDEVITMVFVPDLQKVTCTSLGEADRQAAALAGLRALYRMIFIDGFVHADMHPGNVLLRPDGELVILDTGLCARLSPADRQRFSEFFLALANDQGRRCADIVLAMAVWTGPTFSPDRFESAMVALISRYSALPSRDFEVTRFVYDLIDLQRRNAVRGSSAFIMTVMALVIYDGICKTLYPGCDFQKVARGFLIMSKYGGATAGLSHHPQGSLTPDPDRPAKTRCDGSSA